MEEAPKNHEENVGANGAEMLSEMPSFEEHMAKKAEQEKVGSAGEVYGEIAKTALMKWNGLTEEEATKKVAESSFDELEGVIGAKKSILAATKSIADKLYLDEDALAQAVLHGNNEEIFDEAAEMVEDFGFNEEFMDEGYESENNKEKFVLDILSDVHDNWCANNEAKFFDKKRDGKRYQFLKLELIGFKEATTDLIFVEPILRKIGIEVDLENIEEQYADYPYDLKSDAEQLSDEFYHTGGDDGSIPMGSDFAEGLFAEPSRYLSKGASKEIDNAIRGNFEVAAEITEQVGEHRFFEEIDLDALSAYHEGGEADRKSVV